ncbi:abc transporter [Trichoderma arundinaceum]|uniref:Abc transporter n=1 Tax=Trichoderma arundinaceum TaxID=490622 RepID=A0A395NHF8_TRIAR|nr:abc transporter [Trichoderma arundinaceum]
MSADGHGPCIGSGTIGILYGCTTSGLPAVEYRWIFWFSVATAGAFSALATPRVLHLSGLFSRYAPPATASAPVILLATKLVASAAFASLRLALLIVTLRQVDHPSTRFVASTALDFAAACILLVLSLLEHLRRPSPSVLACSFLFLAFVYDITRCPFLWTASRRHGLNGDHATFSGLFTATTVVEFSLLVLESVRRRRWVGWDAADHSPEETSSILSLGLYAWLNPLLWRGYREPLTMKHLYALDRAISVETIDVHNTPKSDSGSSGESAGTGTSVWHIVLWLAKPLGYSLLLPVLPRLCLLGFTFCQTFLLQRLLDYLSSHGNDSSTASTLVTIAVLTYFGIAVSTALYWYYQERFQSLLRGFLISSIYRKTAYVQHVGDGDSAAVTLMSADVDRIYTGLRFLHEVWVNVIQIALAAWLVQRQLGLAFLAPLVVVLLGFAGSFALSRRAVPYQSAWMARVQKRIGVTSAVLGNIKDLRISGMTTPAITLLQREREEECRTGERSRVLIAVSASLSQMPQAVAPALAFAFGPHVLDETRAFTALSFLALLTAPLLVVLQSLPIIAACVACLRRIKVFLDKEERIDGRLLDLTGKTNEKTEMMDGFDADEEGFIIVQDALFGWAADNTVLQNINLSLSRASITFVIGPVASGKSTLCRALLGEVPHAQGRIVLKSDKVAYCDQAPFIFNASIMDNIVGFSSFDALRYADVIQATLLVEDLKQLPSGDKTIIGTKGISLSGGQRQRVSLARALYHDAEILVLDDVFSGLDGATQDLVCQSVFGPRGLLRRRGTTAIICTQSIHFLSVADHVVALSSTGHIAEQGSFAEISRDEQRALRIGLVSVLDHTSKLNQADVEVNEISIIEVTPKPEASQPAVKTPVTKAQPTSANPPAVDAGVYRYWLSTIGPLPLVFYVLFIISISFCSNFPTIWVKLWSADSVSLMPKHSFAFWIGIYVLLGVGLVLCVFPAGLVMLRTAVRLAGNSLHHAAVDTVMHSSLRFLGSTDVGKVLNLFSQDINIMDTQLPRMVNNLCICLAIAVGQLVVIATSSAWLAISYPFFIALLWGVQHIYLPSSKRLRILDLEAKTPLYTNFLDTLAGLPTIRALGWFQHQLARNNALLDDSQRPSYLLAMAQQWLMLTVNLLVTIIAVVLTSVAAQLGSNAGSVGAGLVSLITLGSTLTTIIIAYTGLETSLGAISRLKSFEEQTEQEDHTSDDVIPDKGWPMNGRVQMQDIEASYNDTSKVLKGLSLVVEAKQKIAICGRTGSGKSSILALLLRLIDPLPSDTSNTAGVTPAPILIDGLPLDTINRTILRERIISASQDAIFLPSGTTFQANLDPWAAASSDDCLTVLQDLGLATAIESKGGLGAAANGAELSAGQKQLFSLARVVLRRRVKRRETNIDGGLLLLDEITSSADAETERQVLRVLEEEFAAYTMVMVTHRKEMAMTCDRVIVLDAGKVVEDGRPKELLGREQGWFKRLWVSQNP